VYHLIFFDQKSTTRKLILPILFGNLGLNNESVQIFSPKKFEKIHKNTKILSWGISNQNPNQVKKKIVNF